MLGHHRANDGLLQPPSPHKLKKLQTLTTVFLNISIAGPAWMNLCLATGNDQKTCSVHGASAVVRATSGHTSY